MHEIQESALKREIFTFYWLTNELIFCIILNFSQENKALKMQKNPEKNSLYPYWRQKYFCIKIN